MTITTNILQNIMTLNIRLYEHTELEQKLNWLHKGMVKTMADSFEVKLADALSEWTDEVDEQVDQVLDDISKEALKMLKEKSPRSDIDEKHYADLWHRKKFKTLTEKSFVLANRHYQLTHLLENGHAKKGGKGRVKSIEHIYPVQEWASEELEKRVKEVLSK